MHIMALDYSQRIKPWGWSQRMLIFIIINSVYAGEKQCLSKPFQTLVKNCLDGMCCCTKRELIENSMCTHCVHNVYTLNSCNVSLTCLLIVCVCVCVYTHVYTHSIYSSVNYVEKSVFSQ